MINLETVKTLRVLRLPGMARELESQLEDPQRYKGLSFEERLALLVDAESSSRHQNTISRRMRDARLSEATASVEAIEYHEDRRLDRGLITRLATCAFIRDNHHVILKGATGAGKTYIANALGVAACRKLYKVRYVRLPGQFGMNVRTVGLHVHVNPFRPFRIKQFVEPWVGKAFVERPANVFVPCKLDDFPDRVSRAVKRFSDLGLSVLEAVKPQDFAIIYHDHRPPCLIVTLTCATFIIRER